MKLGKSYLGSTPINKRYLGANIVYGNSDQLIRTGIEHYYKLEATTADEVGSDDGSLVDCSYVTGIINQGIRCVTNDGKLEVSSNSANWMHNTATLSFWFKRAQINDTALKPIFQQKSFDTTTGNQVARMIETDGSGQFLITTNKSGIDIGWGSGVIHNFNTWYHLVTVFDGGKVTFYVNGALIGDNGQTPGTITFGSLPVRFGDKYGNPSSSIYVNIDEIGYWSRELTQANVTELYNGGAGLSYPFT